MRELEEDVDVRSRVNLYKDPRAAQQYVPPPQQSDEFAPAVDVAELLDGLTLDDAQAGPDEDDGEYDDRYVLAPDHDMADGDEDD